MRTFILTLSCLVALAFSPPARAADGTSVHAILIVASTAKAPADPRLAPYEATLQRNLPESSFRFGTEGKASLNGKAGTATLSLGAHRLELEGGGRDSDGIRVKVRWLTGGNLVMTNTFNFQPGVPFVLGQRPSHDGDVPLIIVIVE